jgi:hypothetical protein
MRRGPKLILLGYGVLLLAFGACWPWLHQKAVWRAEHPGSSGDTESVTYLIYGFFLVVLAMAVHLAIILRKSHAWPYRIVIVGLASLLAYRFFKYDWHYPRDFGEFFFLIFPLALGISFWRHRISAWLCRFGVAVICAWWSVHVFESVRYGGVNFRTVFVLFFCAGNCATCLSLVPARHLERVGMMLHQTWLFALLYVIASEGLLRGEMEPVYIGGYMAAASSFFALYCFRMYDLRMMFDRQVAQPQGPPAASA